MCFGMAILLFNGSCKNEKLDKLADISCSKYILAQDDSLGSVRNHASEHMPISQSVVQYIKELSKLNFDDCPDDFVEAFEEHMSAWLNVIPILEKYPDARAEMHEVFKEIESGIHQDTFKILVDEIWSTWAKVEKASGKK